MSKEVRGALFWSPRVLAILLALFLSVFALDVFTEAQSVPDTLAALFVHLIPAFIVIAILGVAWRRDFVGAYAFAGLAIVYVLGTAARLHWTAYVAVSGPLLLISFLFLLSWRQRLPAQRGVQPPSGQM